MVKMIEVQGFKVLPLRTVPGVKHCHSIFVKEHSIKKVDEHRPVGKTLFLNNIPPYLTPKDIRFCFEGCGEIKDVIFEDRLNAEKEGGRVLTADNKFCLKDDRFEFHSAYLIFEKTKSVQNALKLSELKTFNEEGKSGIFSGVKKWRKSYMNAIETEDCLMTEINQFMAEYDKKEADIENLEKKGIQDDEGWTVVTKRGKNAGFAQKESVLNKLEEKVKKNKKKRELKNFYTFQIRESKMQHIVKLRKKFEEDKQRIEIMKKSRKFKPF